MSDRDIRQVLVGNSPSFKAHWESVAPDGKLAIADADLDDLLWVFARHLLELHQDSRTASFPKIISSLLSFYESGSHADREAVAQLLGCIGYDWWDSGVEPSHFFSLVPDTLQRYCVVGPSRA